MPISQSQAVMRPGSLVLYKSRPAVVTAQTEKIEIQLAGGQVKRVRGKDVRLLHPGPADLGSLAGAEPEVEEAWELMQGESPDLAEFAEILCGEFTPAAAWQAWQQLNDGLHFEGDLDAIRARPAQAVAEESERRAAKAAETAAWEGFLARVERGALVEDDRRYMAEAEKVAFGQGKASKLLAHFSVEATPSAAHAFLLRCGWWQQTTNPWPRRLGIDLTRAAGPIADFGQETREDLTHLKTFAIDDEGNQDPDDAVSLDGARIWVHVADVAAIVTPASEADAEAGARGATLYLPEQTVPMLAPALTAKLGMGLQDVSPALSIGFVPGPQGPEQIEIKPTYVKVQRLSYKEADGRLDAPVLADLAQHAAQFRRWRDAQGATSIDLPEVSLRVVDNAVQVTPLERSASRAMVTELMLMAGEAVGRFGQDHEIPLPYMTQAAPAETCLTETFSERYASRRQMKPGQAATVPGLHAGLGLRHYVRATSPLRRYLDLIAHQQLRAHIAGRKLLSAAEVGDRIVAAIPASGRIRKCERSSNLHWKLLWLEQQKPASLEGIVVALEARKAVVLIPVLAMETRIRKHDAMQRDQVLQLQVQSIDLPAQVAYFRAIG